MERTQIVLLALVASFIIAIAYDLVSFLTKSAPVKYYRLKFWINSLVRVFTGLMVVIIVAIVYMTLPSTLDFISSIVVGSIGSMSLAYFTQIVAVGIYLMVPVFFISRIGDWDFWNYSKEEKAFIEENNRIGKEEFNKVVNRIVKFFRRIKIGKRK